MSRIISFRGLLADGAQERISLQTIRGETGYRITKFELMTNTPGVGSGEHIAKIYKVEQTLPVDSLVDFSDQRLLGAAQVNNHSAANAYPAVISVVFDNEVFNQDIFITHTELISTGACNYYIELEQMDLAMDEATVATLKDIRNND